MTEIYIDTGGIRGIATELSSMPGQLVRASIGCDNGLIELKTALGATGWGFNVIHSLDNFNACWGNDVSNIMSGITNAANSLRSYCDAVDTVENAP